MSVKPFARWVIIIAAGLGLAALCLSQAGRIAQVSELEAYFPYLSTLVQTLRTIDEFYVDEIDMGKLLKYGTKRLVSSLDGRSTVLFADEARQPQADLGLNIMLKGGLFVVISREVNSPAFDSEIMPGDRIDAIDGHSIRGMTLDELRRDLRGKPQSEITLTVYGPDDFKAKRVELRRRIYASSPAAFSAGEDGVLNITIRTFADGVSKTFKEALSQFGRSRLKGIIIDVRDNIGGSIGEVTNICSRFVSSGPIFARSSGSSTKNAARDGSVAAMSESVPVVVLINKRTVGEAEVLAACLRGHGVARLVGETTFGFALGTECIATTDGTRVILSTSEYLGPFGQQMHKVGLEPDIAISMGKDASEDLQMRKAHEVILNWSPIEAPEPAAEKDAA